MSTLEERMVITRDRYEKAILDNCKVNAIRALLNEEQYDVVSKKDINRILHFGEEQEIKVEVFSNESV